MDKRKQRLENEQGELSYFTIFFILAINMLGSRTKRTAR